MRDVFTEPVPDPNTLDQLGPLRPLAGVWTGRTGIDTHPVATGGENNQYVETIELFQLLETKGTCTGGNYIEHEDAHPR